MAVNLDGYRNKPRIDKELKLQTTQQKSVDPTFSQNETNLRQRSETAPPDRPLRQNFCEKVVSTLIKIITFTDTLLISLLPKFLSKSFSDVDIEVTEHRNEESFFQSLNPDDSTSHFIIIKSERHAKRLLDRTHSYSSVESIYLQCDSSELKYQRRLARNYSKVDAVFDDHLRLWLALIMDIALFCEEKADRQKRDISLMKAAHKNYQRSMDLYALTKRLL